MIARSWTTIAPLPESILGDYEHFHLKAAVWDGLNQAPFLRTALLLPFTVLFTLSFQKLISNISRAGGAFNLEIPCLIGMEVPDLQWPKEGRLSR
jgi:hypothetical protein